MDKRTFLKICGITGIGMALGVVACTGSLPEKYAWERNWMWLCSTWEVLKISTLM